MVVLDIYMHAPYIALRYLTRAFVFCSRHAYYVYVVRYAAFTL